MAETTTIQVSIDNWQWLNSQKRPNESFDDVITNVRQRIEDIDSMTTIDAMGGVNQQPLQDTSETPETNSEPFPIPDDVPGRINAEDARAAIRAAIEYVENNGGATKKEIIPEIMPDHDCGYDVEVALEKIEKGERFRGAYWRRIIKPGLKQSERIETPAPHESEWTYR